MNERPPSPPKRPNIVLILADDLGYSDIGCFGGEIATPNLDRLAASGVRLTTFYNTARCSPSRASLITGRHPHETGVGVLTDNFAPYGAYPGTLSPRFPTAAEHLKRAGYTTCLAGKWHLSSNTQTPDEAWPTRRGFDQFFGIMPGADSYFHPRNLWRNEERCEIPREDFYVTDAISDHAVEFVQSSAAAGTPFFLYLAYTAPHWPLHAREEDIGKYAGRFESGWDQLRRERYERMRADAIVGPESALSERDPTQPPWSEVAHKTWETRRMSTYAAQVESMDTGIGRVVQALEASGVRDNTLVIFLSDNGACAEDMPPDVAPMFMQRQPTHTPTGEPLQIGNEPSIVPGPDTTYCSYGRAWANLSNTPFRYYKRWVHEGGIATPLIASWPAGGLANGTIDRTPYQLVDVLPTIADVAGLQGVEGPGLSMLPTWRGGAGPRDHTLFWEHVGNAALREGNWKIVRIADAPWELYDVSVDRSEIYDLAAQKPDVLDRLVATWETWARSVGVIPWDQMRDLVKRLGG
jgi:arylsulfatase A-like enzyme